MTYEVVFEIKITQGGLMVKKSSYFKIVFEGDVYYFHNDKLAIWFHHSSALDCIKQSNIIHLKMIFDLYDTPWSKRI